VKDTDMGYPIAAIQENGHAVISMEKGKHGLVNISAVASQLLYEIQGPLYYNSDVTASIEDIEDCRDREEPSSCFRRQRSSAAINH
jgi:predicted RNA-binding protein with RPS1 domain